MADRSIFSPCCGRPKMAASIGRSLSNARAPQPCAASGRHPQARKGRRGSTTQGQTGRTAGRLSGFQRNHQAADWVILLTSLHPMPSRRTMSSTLPFAMAHRTGFKRLKSLIASKARQVFDERSARPYVLVHLLIILLLEPLVDGLEDSPPCSPRLNTARRLAHAQTACRNTHPSYHPAADAGAPASMPRHARPQHL